MRDLCRAFKDGRLPNSMADDIYYNVRRMKNFKPPDAQRATGMSKRIAVVTGGAGFIGSHMVDLLLARDYRVRVIDSLVGGREANLAQHRDDARLAFERRDIRALEPGDTLFKNAAFVFHFAGIGDIVPSIERPIDYMDTNVHGHGARAGMRARGRGAKIGLCGVVLVLRPGGRADLRGLIRSRRSILTRLSKYHGEAAVLHWHRVYRLPVNSIRIFNAYGPRVRTTGAYGAVFGVFFKQKLAGKPFTVIGDGTQRRDFLFVTDVAAAFLRAAETDKTGRDLESRRRRSAKRESARRIARRSGGLYSEAAGRARLHLGRYRQDPARTRLEARGALRSGRPPHDGGHRTLARCAAVGSAVDRCRRPRRGLSIWDGRPDVVELLGSHYKHKIKTPEEIAALVGEMPRKRKVIMCHGVFDVVHPGHLRHLLYAKSKADILVASLTADRHISKGRYRPHVPQDLRAVNLAAFEIVDYVIIDPEPTPLKNIALIKPDIFAKGYEYQASGLPLKTQDELDLIRSYGGEIIFTPGDYVFSSSQLIEASPPSLRIEKLVTLMESADITFDKLRRVLDTLGGRRVHVVGDIIVDTFTYTSMIGGQTKTPTISVLFEHKTDYIGGAGIVAEHLRAAGADVMFSTVLGEDALKDFVLEGLSKSGVECQAGHRQDPADDQQERDHRRRLSAAQDRHAR